MKLILSYWHELATHRARGNLRASGAIAGAAFIVNSIAHDGETMRFEGVMLMAIYAVLAMAFCWLLSQLFKRLHSFNVLLAKP